MGNLQDKPTLSIRAAAELLGISKNLAYDLARQGNLPGALHLGQKRIIVSRVQLERFLEGNHESV